MRTICKFLGAALLLLTGVGADAAEQRTTVPEPADLWPGPMHGFTPATLKGARVIDAKALEGLLARDKPVMIDVANVEPKPVGAPKDQMWAPIHRSIPGATWLPGGGNGSKDPGFTNAFDSQVASMTGGDLDKPIVTFCHPQRWGSWNAAKRLTLLGYKHVYWLPGGSEAWTDHQEPAPVSEDPRWKAKGFDKDPMLYRPPARVDASTR